MTTRPFPVSCSVVITYSSQLWSHHWNFFFHGMIGIIILDYVNAIDVEAWGGIDLTAIREGERKGWGTTKKCPLGASLDKVYWLGCVIIPLNITRTVREKENTGFGDLRKRGVCSPKSEIRTLIPLNLPVIWCQISSCWPTTVYQFSFFMWLGQIRLNPWCAMFIF